MEENRDEIIEEKKKIPRWVPFAALAVLLGILFFVFWWPVPLEEAYELKALEPEKILAIRDGVGEELVLNYELQAKSPLLKARAAAALRRAVPNWTSEEAGVVSVSETGRVQALDEGKTQIHMSLGNLQTSWQLEVYYPLMGLALDNDNLILNKRTSAQLSFGPIPPQAECPSEGVWTSSDPSVAVVSASGRVSALAPGQCEITMKAGDMEVVCPVTVLSPLQDMKLKTPELAMNVGETLQAEMVLTPEDTTDSREGVWSSDNPEIATVDKTGRIQALKPGHTLIRVQLGDFSDSLELEVFAPLTSLAFTEEEIRILKNESHQLEMVYEPLNTTDDLSAGYDSSDWNAVRVSEDGVVTAVGPGEAVITAWVADYEIQCKVIVRVPMSGIDIDGPNRSISRGERQQLRINYLPADTNDDRTIIWESSDPTVVSIDEQGGIEGLKPGSVLITARCGEFESKIRVAVVIPATGVRISETHLSLLKGQSASLSAAVEPSDTTEDQSIHYYSTDPSVATVNSSGQIQAVGGGSCRIVAAHGNLSASCQVDVKAPLKGISLSEASLNLYEGASKKLSVSYDPWDTTDDKSVRWSSSDPSVASVDGGQVKALKAGDCTITAQVGSHSVSASVHVNPYIWVSGLSLSRSEIYFNERGATVKLEAYITPGNANNQSISWSSSSNGVARVDQNGNVSVTGSGSAVITATAEGGISASCQVTADLPAAPVTIVLDPGHGGPWMGAIGVGGSKEKDLNLATAYACKYHLETYYRNVTVILTRYGDGVLNSNSVGTDIAGRAALANRNGATIVVSLHFNASPTQSGRGVEVYYSSRANVTSASRGLAESIFQQIRNLGFIGRGVYGKKLNESDGTDYYQIIRDCASYGIPAVLVEHCFMDNAQDYAMLDTDQLGVADAKGIANFLGLQPK